MKVITPGDETIDLGATETTPTIGITDYSRRVTDDFGVTTVVPRAFSRRMSVRFALPSDQVDSVQRQLAALRAEPVQWIADDRFAWLGITGFFKDFQLDLQTGSLSFCTLTVEGLAETEAGADPGGDPSPSGASSLLLLDPVAIADAMLVSSNVPEDDFPEWSGATTYAAGARVIVAATHRIYESAGEGNIGNDPAALTGQWIDVGPTNRWAMFDQSLGTTTIRASGISVTIDAGAVDAIALLDVVGTAVRVQTTGYDHTQVPGDGALTFLDLPGIDAPITVTVSSVALAGVGTLLVGSLKALGVTETSPTAGINDFSRKEVDEFGEVTVVPRGWAKRMSARALIRTDAVDAVANRIAAVRARPALWIGDDGTDALTVYGFFKDFSIELGETVGTLSLSIEGLSEASPPGPGLPAPDWVDVIDSDPVNHPKPEDGATVGAPSGTPVGDRDADDITQQVDEANQKADDLIATYGSTASAAASASAAEGFKGVAEAAAANAEAAANAAGDDAAAAHTSKLDAESAAGTATVKATEAATSATNALGSMNTASSHAGLAAASADDAAGSATASADSAAIASTKATDAGNSATAAEASQVAAEAAQGDAAASASAAEASAASADADAATASTQAGLAATYKGDAQTAATAASGSAATATAQASAAATSSTLSATYASTRGLTPNGSFDNGLNGFYRYQTLTGPISDFSEFVPSELGRTNLLRTPVSTPVNVYGSRISVQPGRKYIVRAGVWKVSASLCYVGFAYYASDGSYISNTTAAIVASSAWQDFNSVVLDTTGMPANTAYIAPVAILNNGSDVNRVRVDYLYAEDVTESTAASSQASIATSQAAIATSQAAAAQSSATLSASMASQGYLPNSSFALWSGSYPDGYANFGAGTTVSKLSGGRYGSPNYLRTVGPNPSVDGLNGGIFQTQAIPASTQQPFFTNQYVILEVDARVSGDLRGAGVLFRVGTTSNQDAFVDFYNDPDISGTVGNGSAGSIRSWRKLVKMSGTATTLNTNIRQYLFGSWSAMPSATSAATSRTIDWFYVNVRSASGPEVETNQIAPLSATVTTQGSVLATHDTKLASWLARTSAGAGYAEISLSALDSNNVSASRIGLTADWISFGSANQRVMELVSGKVQINGDLNVTNGKIVADTGTHMKVIGKGFGTSNQFIEWFGPKMAFNLCSEANAITYIKTNGDAYFGGSLHAGVITNSIRTTLASATSLTLGDFISDGGLVNITAGAYAQHVIASDSGNVWAVDDPAPDPYTGSRRIYRTVHVLETSINSGSSWTTRGTYTEDFGSTSVAQPAGVDPELGPLRYWQHIVNLITTQTTTVTLGAYSSCQVRLRRTSTTIISGGSGSVTPTTTSMSLLATEE